MPYDPKVARKSVDQYFKADDKGSFLGKAKSFLMGDNEDEKKKAKPKDTSAQDAKNRDDLYNKALKGVK